MGVDTERFTVLNLVENAENGRFEAGENECLCRNKENIR